MIEIVIIVLAVLAPLGFIMSLSPHPTHTKDWPSVPGTIVVSEPVNMGMGWLPKSKILYKYTVDGKKYRRRSVFLGEWLAAQNMHIMYPVGRTIDVFYNPEKHGESVLLHHSS